MFFVQSDSKERIIEFRCQQVFGGKTKNKTNLLISKDPALYDRWYQLSFARQSADKTLLKSPCYVSWLQIQVYLAFIQERNTQRIIIYRRIYAKIFKIKY